MTPFTHNPISYLWFLLLIYGTNCQNCQFAFDCLSQNITTGTALNCIAAQSCQGTHTINVGGAVSLFTYTCSGVQSCINLNIIVIDTTFQLNCRDAKACEGLTLTWQNSNAVSGKGALVECTTGADACKGLTLSVEQGATALVGCGNSALTASTTDIICTNLNLTSVDPLELDCANANGCAFGTSTVSSNTRLTIRCRGSNVNPHPSCSGGLTITDASSPATITCDRQGYLGNTASPGGAACASLAINGQSNVTCQETNRPTTVVTDYVCKDINITQRTAGQDVQLTCLLDVFVPLPAAQHTICVGQFFLENSGGGGTNMNCSSTGTPNLVCSDNHQTTVTQSSPTNSLFCVGSANNCFQMVWDCSTGCTCTGQCQNVLRPTTPPTSSPTPPTQAPTFAPTTNPSSSPTTAPSLSPTTTAPSFAPTGSPSTVPSSSPTTAPSSAPSESPSYGPTSAPSAVPSAGPSSAPSFAPTSVPSAAPSSAPSSAPTYVPTNAPSEVPSSVPSSSPSRGPSSSPSRSPTTSAPSVSPSTSSPSASPTQFPSRNPSQSPSQTPTQTPSTSAPSQTPTQGPSKTPSRFPSDAPSVSPSVNPSVVPSSSPSSAPSAIPSLSPSSSPTAAPSQSPTTSPPSAAPTTSPPSGSPSASPSSVPSSSPSLAPSTLPSISPTSFPTHATTAVPTSIVTVAQNVSCSNGTLVTVTIVVGVPSERVANISSILAELERDTTSSLYQGLQRAHDGCVAVSISVNVRRRRRLLSGGSSLQNVTLVTVVSGFRPNEANQIKNLFNSPNATIIQSIVISLGTLLQNASVVVVDAFATITSVTTQSPTPAPTMKPEDQSATQRVIIVFAVLGVVGCGTVGVLVVVGKKGRGTIIFYISCQACDCCPDWCPECCPCVCAEEAENVVEVELETKGATVETKR